MWGRVLELNAGIWLALSPFIFKLEPGSQFWFQEIYAALIFLFSSLSFYPKLRLAYLSNFLLALIMVLVARFLGEHPPTPIQQNNIYVGFYLALIALIPNWASVPPPAWRAIEGRPSSN